MLHVHSLGEITLDTYLALAGTGQNERVKQSTKLIVGRICNAGTYSNLVKQAKSKQKILDKMEAAGLTPPVQHESTFHFQFPDCDKLPPPVLPFQDVSFAYSGKDQDCLYRVSLLFLQTFFRAADVLSHGSPCRENVCMRGLSDSPL